MSPLDITIQTYVNGRWHDAARLTLTDPEAGWRGATRLAYDDARKASYPRPGLPHSGIRQRTRTISRSSRHAVMTRLQK